MNDGSDSDISRLSSQIGASSLSAFSGLHVSVRHCVADMRHPLHAALQGSAAGVGWASALVFESRRLCCGKPARK